MDARSSRLRTALDVLYFSGAYRAMKPFVEGAGAIFMLHRVLPGANGTRADAFDPNAFLAVSPDFLDRAIARVRAHGFEIVDLDEAARRLETGEGARFACFTLDDGYRDNRDHALPVFARHGCPFTVYVASGFASRSAVPWWVMLERLIAREERVALEVEGETHALATAGPEEKSAAYVFASDLLSGIPWPAHEAAVARLVARYGLDPAGLCEELTMGWDELADFAGHPLVTLGAHTRSHPVLANLDAESSRREIEEGADEMERRLGLRPRHLAYPYGHGWAAGQREFSLARELGFRTAVTTRKGLVYPEHGRHMMALPRVSLNGDYQAERYVDVLLSGAPFALLNRFRRVHAA